jgi:2-oxoglutarate ferredoxin oxidoreductase subunit gamma
MQTDIIMAGFGGQGILLIGKMLAYAGMHQGKEVSWLPSYGPEMRGGTCNCTVVVSDTPVGSPVVRSPKVVIAMNRPSLDKFEPMLKPKGLLFINSSLIDRKAERSDVDTIYVPANDIAIECGSPKAANMVVLGALVGKTDLVRMDFVKSTIEDTFAGKDKIIQLNFKALERGYALGKGGHA